MKSKEQIRTLGEKVARENTFRFLVDRLKEIIAILEYNPSKETLSALVAAASLIVIKHELQGGLNICDKKADQVNHKNN